MKKFNFTVEDFEGDTKLLEGNTSVVEDEKTSSEKHKRSESEKHDKPMCNISSMDGEIDFSKLGKNFTLKTSPLWLNDYINLTKFCNTNNKVKCYAYISY